MKKEEIKKDLDAIWKKYVIHPYDSEHEVIRKFQAALQEQIEYFKN